MDLFYVRVVLLKKSAVFSPLNCNGAVLLQPSKKINKTFYMCDKMFHLDQILEMYKDEHTNGIVFVSGKMYAFYKIIKSGNHLDIKKLMANDVDLPKGHNKGGQSSVRFSRLHDEAHNNYITKLSELVIKCFMSNNNTEYLIDKLIIAGPSKKKHKLAENELIHQFFKNKIELITTSNLNEDTIYQVINSSTSIFDSEQNKQELKIIEEIQDIITLNPDKLVFGIEEIGESYSNFELEKIIISEQDLKLLTLQENNVTQIIKISDDKLDKLGFNMIGIKWY